MSFTDTDLIARVLSREDHNAFGELVRRYQSPVRAFLTRMARGDSHLADDLAQETFLKAWKKLSSYRGGARFSTWLFGIAINEFRAAARSRKEFIAHDFCEDSFRTGTYRPGFQHPFAPGFDRGAQTNKFRGARGDFALLPEWPFA